MMVDILWGIFLILIILVSSGAVVDSFEKLAHEIKTNKLMLATILVGFSTSLPELFVGLAAAIRSEPQIALGNIIGANLANLSWIIGGAALVFGSIPIVGEYLKRELWMTVGMAMSPWSEDACAYMAGRGLPGMPDETGRYECFALEGAVYL